MTDIEQPQPERLPGRSNPEPPPTKPIPDIPNEPIPMPPPGDPPTPPPVPPNIT